MKLLIFALIGFFLFSVALAENARAKGKPKRACFWESNGLVCKPHKRPPKKKGLFFDKMGCVEIKNKTNRVIFLGIQTKDKPGPLKPYKYLYEIVIKPNQVLKANFNKEMLIGKNHHKKVIKIFEINRDRGGGCENLFFRNNLSKKHKKNIRKRR